MMFAASNLLFGPRMVFVVSGKGVLAGRCCPRRREAP